MYCPVCPSSPSSGPAFKPRPQDQPFKHQTCRIEGNPLRNTKTHSFLRGSTRALRGGTGRENVYPEIDENLMKINQNLWKSMKINGNQEIRASKHPSLQDTLKLMKINQNLTKSMKIILYPEIDENLKKINTNLWKSMKINGNVSFLTFLRASFQA